MSPKQSAHLSGLAEAANYARTLPDPEYHFAHIVLQVLELEIPSFGRPTPETLALLALHEGLTGHAAARVWCAIRRWMI